MPDEIKCPRCGEMVEHEPDDLEVSCRKCAKVVEVVDFDEEKRARSQRRVEHHAKREALRDKLEALAIECAEYDPEVGESDFAAIGRELAELREAGS